MTDFEKKLNEKALYAEEVLKRYMPPVEGYQKTLFEAMAYSAYAGGKRIRPVIMSEFFAITGGKDKEIVEPFMAALEMIHTYSLIHDDLPALDNDDYRRGRLTSHKVFGEAMAILAGDGLLNFAFETAGKALGDAATSGDTERLRRTARAMKVFTEKPGVYGMIGGQVVDVEMSGHLPNKEVIDFVYATKTAALIECAMMIGCILAGADEKNILLAEKIGRYVGLAFQIQDDILDVTSSTEVLGKPVHSDDKNEKKTYVTLLGIDGAKEEVKRLSENAKDYLKEMDTSEDISFMNSLIEYLIDREK